MRYFIFVFAFAVVSGSACAQPAPKAAVDERWECIGVFSTENHPRRAAFANRKGCTSDFYLACENAPGTGEVACLRREAAVWEGVIAQKLVAEARAANKRPDVAAAIEDAARAMRVSRAKTCGFVRKYGVNTNPMSVARCELDATAGFAMTIYGWLYTP